MTNFQDGFIVRDRNKKSRFYIDNEFYSLGYAAAVNHLASVYSVLCKYANAETQRCWPSIDTILKETGLTNRRVVLGIINAFIKPVLIILTLPINILTLGLFTFVINALIIILTSGLVPGFKVNGFWWALLFSIVLSIVNSFLHQLG